MQRNLPTLSFFEEGMYCSDWNFHNLPPSLYSPNERRNKFHLNDEWYQLDATDLFIIINNNCGLVGICSSIQCVQPILLKTGIQMPETCRVIYDNK